MPASPSLLIVPARFKTGKLYTQIATTSAGLVLGSSGDFNVTRATTATRFNSAGLIESVASGVPRLDYYTSGGTAGCPALLIEPAATNSALHSRDLTNVVWSATNITTAKNAVGADGVASGATTLTATAASGTIFQQLGLGVFARVCSAYVRRVTGTGAIQMSVNGGTNWDDVTISSAYTQVASAVRSLASSTVGFRMAVSGDVIEVDFTQNEATNVTSPIPTTAAPVTRNADVINLSGAVSGCIGQTEGTVYVEVDYRNFANITMLSVQTGNAIVSGSVRIENTNNGTQLRCHVRSVSGATVMDQIISSPLLSTGINKIAVGYSNAASGLCIALNGTVVFTGTAAAAFTISPDRINLGSRDVGGAQQLFNNRIRSAALYTTRLTDSELAALTTL